MNQDVGQLLKCLNTHKHIYGQLLEIGEKKRLAIINNDVNLLEQYLKEEEKLIKQVEAVEGLRIKCTEAAGKRLGIKPPVTHKKIMEKDKEAEKEFGNIDKEMRKLFAKLKDLNSVNGALIQKRLDYIDSVKESFFDDKGNNYGSDGKGSEVKIQNMNLFDRMV